MSTFYRCDFCEDEMRESAWTIEMRVRNFGETPEDIRFDFCSLACKKKAVERFQLKKEKTP